MPRLSRRVTLANEAIVAVAPTGTIVVLADPGAIQASDTLTIDDGPSAAKVFTHTAGDGTGTTKDTIDIGGTPTGAELAARIIVAINLANVADECNVTAVIDGEDDAQVNLTNDTASAVGNIAITTTAAEYTVTGMSGGVTAVAGTFTEWDLHSAANTNRTDTVLRSLTFRVPANETLKYAHASGANPDSATGDYCTLVAGSAAVERTITYEPDELAHEVYLNAGATVEIEADYTSNPIAR